jgi:CHAT domain-containing protein
VRYWRDGAVHSAEIAPGLLGIRYTPSLTAAQVVLARREAQSVLQPRTRSVGPGIALTPLPGTRREVEALTQLFPPGQVTTLLGAEATAEAVQERARSGALKAYRYLHLGAHGKMDPDVAMRSALLLAGNGAITAEEIVQTWDLDADLVVLSACESGLGRIAGGEGYLGFAQALFVKGARSLVLSQWKVSDQATALLMTRFYANLLGRRAGLSGPMPKAEALHEAKEWLRTLSVADTEAELKRLNLPLNLASASRGGERKAATATTPAAGPRPFEHPSYWAGFILIGDPW